jgi:hypothetical protein
MKGKILWILMNSLLLVTLPSFKTPSLFNMTTSLARKPLTDTSLRSAFTHLIQTRFLRQVPYHWAVPTKQSVDGMHTREVPLPFQKTQKMIVHIMFINSLLVILCKGARKVDRFYCIFILYCSRDSSCAVFVSDRVLCDL